ncbi:hypothetical protein BE17_45005 [Sorangium cellulosum]|uniref:Ester cyclase n=1 Tax=Sorangium cellulosum TaxID=56 RepID=A0A150SEX8_SORCE|nr:hypothetical protein BE17_45005 [Sorangium cellulosum]
MAGDGWQHRSSCIVHDGDTISHSSSILCSLTSSRNRGPPALPSGPDGIRKLFGTFGAIEQEWTIEDVISEGDKVVVRATNTCNQASFLGIPSHGRKQTFTAMFIHQIADGKIIETWRNADDLGRLLQLGAWFEPGTPQAST